MATVYKKKGIGNYYAAYTGADGGRVDRSTRTTDKREAERRARQWEDEAYRLREGLVDPAVARLAAHARAPLGRHVTDFQNALLDKGSSDRHVWETRCAIDDAIDELRWQTLRDIDAHLLGRSLSERMKRTGTGARSFNARLVAFKSFTRWCVRHGRLAADPLATLSKRRDADDRRWVRRVLSDDELAGLLASTESAPEACGLGGADRAMLYRVLSVTGLRRSEAASLTRGDFHLDVGGGAVVIVAATNTKNGREAVQPIPGSVEPALRAWLACRPAEERLWPLPDKARQRILIPDLQRAGIQPGGEVPGEPVVDFHSFRRGYVTELVRSGATVKEAQTLARHSDPRLTMNVYAQLGINDGRTAVERAFGRLSAFAATPPAPPAATGTTG